MLSSVQTNIAQNNTQCIRHDFTLNIIENSKAYFDFSLFNRIQIARQIVIPFIIIIYEANTRYGVALYAYFKPFH